MTTIKWHYSFTNSFTKLTHNNRELNRNITSKTWYPPEIFN